MLSLQRTNSDNPEFVSLVKKLDGYLAEIDGKEHDFYHQFNKLDKIKYVLLAYKDGVAVGCGAIKEYDAATVEVKRMYVDKAQRGHGVAGKILSGLESWAKELGFTRCILETGKRMPDAVGLYIKSGYLRIPNFPPYEEMDNSVCYEKLLVG